MASWRDLVRDTMLLDVQRERSSPLVQNFGKLVNEAMDLDKTKETENRQEGRSARNTARTALYTRYPAEAAKELGVDMPANTGTMTPPSGADLSKVVYDQYGNPTATYTAPKTVDEPTLAKMYNNYITEIKKADSLNPLISMGRSKPTMVPTYDEWKKKMFPTLSGNNAQASEKSDDEIFSMLGATEEEIKYTMAQEGLTREQLAGLLRQQISEPQ